MTPSRLVSKFVLQFLFLLAFLIPLPLAAQRGEYALVLAEPPLARQLSSRQQLRTAEARVPLARIQAAQGSLQAALAERGIRVTGSAQVLVNAVFVRASREQAEALRSLPGVARIEYLPPIRRHLDRAAELVKAPAAWSAAGGAQNAGLGVKIGILDTGIDNNHPAFQDDSLPVPAGFPKGRKEELPYTNRKIIVARSYVAQLPYADIDPSDSRPDDVSPRDRVGHGTAVAMIAAGARVTGPAASIQGVAPKAYLGNYKIFGSPGVNDTTRTPVVVKALEDALQDGMDIVVLPIGSPAVYGPEDTNCGASGRDVCDVRAQAVENAVSSGLTVVVSAGNDGAAGLEFPALNSIHTPGTAPSAITVGATTNSHVFFAAVVAEGRRLNALFGDGPKPAPTLVAPLRDVARLQDNGRACSPLTTGSLTGAIALIERGDCAFATKVNNAQKAGAAGVVIYQTAGRDYPFAPLGLVETGIPAAMIGNRDGLDLKSSLLSKPDMPVTLDPSLQAVDAEYDTVADFSSQGPSIGDHSIKPELAAVGTDIYTATQKYDPNGELYDPSGFTAAQGTSFAAPLVAGAAALVKQQNARFTPAQLKSAVVNTASSDVRDFQGNPASVTAVGGGKLNAGAAFAVQATCQPAVLSFGVIGPGTLPISRTLRITNTGNASASYGVRVEPRQSDFRATLTPSVSQIPSLPAGGSATVTLRLAGQQPDPGIYEGYIVFADSLRVPYMYVVGDGQPYNVFALQGDGFAGVVKETGWLMTMKVVDRYGVAIPNVPVRFRATKGGGSIYQADEKTDVLGIAAAEVDLGPQLGEQQFTGEVIGTDLVVEFNGTARMQPAIGSVVNAASFQVGPGLAPGSYITIFGAALSDATRVFNTPYLPLSLAGVSVSFDAPEARLSLPGRLHFVSEKQINVQIPWEFQGLNKVKMKVIIGDSYSDVYEKLTLSDYSPAAFEYTDADSGRLLAAVLDSANKLVKVANPAQRGKVISISANGLGPVDSQPPSGEPTPADRLYTVTHFPSVTIGGKAAQVNWAGLAPYNVGLYQINVVVDPDTPTGIQPVVITANGIRSKAANLPVQ